jgi:hypothetical protein
MLINLAHSGDIMIDFNSFADHWRNQEGFSIDMARSALYKAEKIGMI